MVGSVPSWDSQVKEQTQKCVPQTHDKELRSETLQMTIPAGHATGMSAVVTTITEEGIVIEAECIGKVYAAGEFDQNVWTIQGEPNTEVIINRPATVELTCATIVNRIPDLIAAAPGFTTTEKMPTNAFRARDLEFLREIVRARIDALREVELADEDGLARARNDLKGRPCSHRFPTPVFS